MGSVSAAPTVTGTRRPTAIIRRDGGWGLPDLRELWRYRDLLLILAIRDVKLRYKQTILGVAWVVLQPLAAALIFATIFGRFGRLPSDGSPYLLFVFAGLVPWTFFASSLQRAGNSLITDARLITKVYFPRMLIPLASTLAVLIDFAVTLSVFGGLMLIYGVAPTWRLTAIPFFLLLAMVAGIGTSLWLSALNVKYRDFMYAAPFIIQVWMYASPVVYATSIIPDRWRLAYSLNPAAGFIEGFRWALLGHSLLTPQTLAAACLLAGLLFVSGALVFRRVERGFADTL